MPPLPWHPLGLRNLIGVCPRPRAVTQGLLARSPATLPVMNHPSVLVIRPRRHGWDQSGCSVPCDRPGSSGCTDDGCSSSVSTTSPVAGCADDGAICPAFYSGNHPVPHHLPPLMHHLLNSSLGFVHNHPNGYHTLEGNRTANHPHRRLSRKSGN